MIILISYFDGVLCAVLVAVHATPTGIIISSTTKKCLICCCDRCVQIRFMLSFDWLRLHENKCLSQIHPPRLFVFFCAHRTARNHQNARNQNCSFVPTSNDIKWNTKLQPANFRNLTDISSLLLLHVIHVNTHARVARIFASACSAVTRHRVHRKNTVRSRSELLNRCCQFGLHHHLTRMTIS